MIKIGVCAASAIPGLPSLPPLDPISLMSGWLEATDISSMPTASSQTLSNIVVSPNDGTAQSANNAVLGSSTSVSTSDPTFTGTAGSASAYFALDGGDYFKQLNTTMTAASILNNLHRSDNSGGWFAWVGIVPNDDTVDHSLCGNASTGTQTGFNLVVNSSGILQFIQRGATARTVSMLGVPRGVPVVIIVSVNGSASTDNIRLWINTATKATYSGAFGATTVPGVRDFFIGANNGLQFAAAGTQIKSFLWGAGFIDNPQAAALIGLLSTRHNFAYISDASLTMAAFGDSMTFFNLYNKQGTGSDLAANAEGQYTNYLAFSNNRMKFPRTNNLGVSGNTSAQMIARMAGNMQGRVCDLVFIMAPTNDLGNTACNSDADAATLTAATIANLKSMYDFFATALGKRVIAVTIPPRDKWGAFTAPQIVYGRQNIKTVNAAIMAEQGSRGGLVRCIDLYSLINNGSDGPLANATVDNLHFSPYGGMIYGMGLRDALAPVYGSGPAPDFTAGNLLANGMLSGTSGTLSGATGAVADSFSAVLTGGSCIASKPVSTVQQLSFSCGAGASSAASVKLSQTVATGFAVGDTVYAQAVIEIKNPTPVRILESSLNLVLSGTGTSGLTSVTGMGPWGAGVYIAETYIQPGEYLVQTPDMPVAAGTGLSLEWFYRMTGDTATGLQASGVVQIKGAGLFKR